MSIAAEKVAEVLALPEENRAFLVHRLIASLDSVVDADAETQWREVIDRRSREMDEGHVDDRSERQMGKIQAGFRNGRRSSATLATRCPVLLRAPRPDRTTPKNLCIRVEFDLFSLGHE